MTDACKKITDASARSLLLGHRCPTYVCSSKTQITVAPTLLLISLIATGVADSQSSLCPTYANLRPNQCFVSSDSYQYSVCHYTNYQGTLNLKHCHCGDISGFNELSCLDMRFRALSIETDHFIRIKSPRFSSNAELIPTSLTVSYNSDSPTSDLDHSFELLPSNQFRVDRVEINGFNFSDTASLADFLSSNSPLAQQVTISHSTIPKPQLRPIISSKSLSRLREVSIKNSHIHSLTAGSFQLTRSVLKLELVNLTIADKFFYSAFYYDANSPISGNDSATLITIYNCNLSSSKFRPEPFLDLKKNNTDTLRIKLDMRNNSFAGTVPESVFGQLIRTHWNRSDVHLSLELDPINCCHESAQWLIDLLAGEGSRSSSSILSKCQDIEGDLSVAKALSRRCGHKKVYPILTVVIVAVLILAAILAIVSLICILYILPKKGNIIRITNDGGKAADADQSRLLRPGFSKTGESRDTASHEISSSSQSNVDSRMVQFSTKASDTVAHKLKATNTHGTRQSKHEFKLPYHIASKEETHKDKRLMHKRAEHKSPSTRSHQTGEIDSGLKLNLRITKEPILHQAKLEKVVQNRKSPRSPMSPVKDPAGSREVQSLLRSQTHAGNKKEHKPKKLSSTVPVTVDNKKSDRSEITRMSHALK